MPTTRIFVFIAFAIVVVLGGCERGPANSGNATDQQLGPSVGTDTSEVRGGIRPGWGIFQPHIGMATSELTSDWKATMPPFDSGGTPGNLYNAKAGIAVGSRDKTVDSISFFYLGKGFQPSTTKTVDGIGAGSTSNDVRQVYGDPSYIAPESEESLGIDCRKGMTITFVERGIEFVFADDSLVSIGVFEPDDDFDYKKFREGVKDLYLYIRDPESKK